MLRQAALVCRSGAAHPRPPAPPQPASHPRALPQPGQYKSPGQPWPIQAVPPTGCSPRPRLLRLSQHRRRFHTSPRAAILARAAQPRSPEPRTSSLPRQTRLHGQRGPNQAPRGTDAAAAAAAPGPPKWKMLSSSHRFQAILPGLKWLEKTEGASLAEAQDTFRSWDRMFQHLYRRLRGEPLQPLVEAAESPGGALARDLVGLDTVEAMRARWLEEPVDHRKLCWPNAMLATMDSHPERAAEVLEATIEDGVVPFWTVPDVFAWLAAVSSKDVPAHLHVPHHAALPGLLLHILETTPPRTFQLQGWIVGFIVSQCDPHTAASLYKALREYQHPLHFNTQFQIASVLAQDGRYRMLGLEILENTLSNPRVDPNDRRCAALATKLVTLPAGSKQGLVSPVHMQAVGEAFARLIDRGYTPNLFTYSALIRSLTSTKEFAMAWKMFDVMLDQGLRPDPYLFLVLLTGAKRAARSDLAARAIKYAPSSVLQDPVICHELIHSILTLAYEEYKWTRAPAPHSNPGFGPMLAVYSKFFGIEPLQKLIPQDLSHHLAQEDPDNEVYAYAWQHALIPLINHLPALPEDRKLEPGVPTLNAMLAGYIRSHASVEPVWELYTHFLGLLQNRDPLALSLPKGSTIIYDLVIKALVDNAGMLDRALGIVASMLEAASPSSPSPPPFSDAVSAEPPEPTSTGSDASVSQEPPAQEPSVPHPVAPSVYTWSILIYSVIRSRQPLKSLELLRMMQSYGVKPDRATWTTLIGGFAGTRHDDEAGKALRSLAEEGFHVDAHTVRAVGRMRRAEDVLVSLDKLAEADEKRVEAEINEATNSVPPLNHEETARVVLRRETKRGRKTERLRGEIELQRAKGLRLKVWAVAQKHRKARMARLLECLLPEGSDLDVQGMSLVDILNKIKELGGTEAPVPGTMENVIAFVSTKPGVDKVADGDAPEPPVVEYEPEPAHWVDFVPVERLTGLPSLARRPKKQPLNADEPAGPEDESVPSAAAEPGAEPGAEPAPAPEPQTAAQTTTAPPSTTTTTTTPISTPNALDVDEYMSLFEEYSQLQDEAAAAAAGGSSPTPTPTPSSSASSNSPPQQPDWLFEPLDPEDDLEDAVNLQDVSAEIRQSGRGRGRASALEQLALKNRATSDWLERLAAAGPGAAPAALHPPWRDEEIEAAVRAKKRYLGKKVGRNPEHQEGGDGDGEEAFQKLYEISRREEAREKEGEGPPANF